jgi:hypothetical protein
MCQQYVEQIKNCWDVRVGVIKDTGHGVVPSSESSQETETTSGLDELCLWASTGGENVPESEHEEGHVEGKEEKEERNCGSESCNQEESSEDEPALR